MGLIDKIFNKRMTVKSAKIADEAGSASDVVKWSPQYIDMLTEPCVASSNYMTLFGTVPEVFWPIDYIASRIAGAHFELKRSADDSVVWCNRRMNRILSQPNAMMGWQEMIYMHFVHKLTTGNAYMRAAMSEAFKESLKWKMCSNFWELPPTRVSIEPASVTIPLYGIAELEEIIKCYKISDGVNSDMAIPPYQIWHDRDGAVDMLNTDFMKAKSRLGAQCKTISNLIAVYEARNIIYVKRGGLGFLVSLKKDETGSAALTPDERKEITEQHFENYGIGRGKLPYGLSNVPLGFIRTNLSISELMPFDETLADAISIAGAYGIPAVLVPRKDQSTFSNQSTAEKSVYTSTIIPMAKRFCEGLTSFLGLDQSGYYLDCNFSDVDCLQQGLKEAEEVKTLTNERCSLLFDKGLITLNDWRAQIHESMIEDIPLFGKLKFQMTDDELETIKKIFNTIPGGQEDERGNQKPAIQDEGE